MKFAFQLFKNTYKDRCYIVHGIDRYTEMHQYFLGSSCIFMLFPQLKIHSHKDIQWALHLGKYGHIFFNFYDFMIRYFLHLHFQCYPKSPPTRPPTPTSWPWRSLVLRHIKFARPRGLSFQWWPTRPSSDTYADRDTSSRGYWLVHIVVPPIGLQIPLAPWVLSLAPPLGALWSIQ